MGRSRSSRMGCALLALSALACGDTVPGVSPMPDAGVVLPQEPMAPEWRASDCPAGWSVVHEELDVSGCHPWPVGEPEDCTGATAHFPGGSGCVEVGPACPEDGDFAVGLPGDAEVVYVRAGRTGPGLGTLASPFDTVARALEAAGDGAVVALSIGEHEIAALTSSVTLRGACASGTVLAAVGPDPGPLVDVQTGRASIQDLTIRVDDRSAVTVGGDGSLDMSGVLMEVTAATAIEVAGGTLSGRDVVIRGPVAGLQVDGGDVTIERVAVTSTSPAPDTLEGLFHVNGGTVSLTDVVLRNAPSDGLIVNGGMLSAHRVVSEGSREYGVRVRNRGQGDFFDLVVRGSAASRAEDAPGITVRSGARATMTRVLVEDVSTYGIRLRDEGVLDLSDAIVRDTRSRVSDGEQGMGISVTDNSEVRLSRGAFLRNRDSGVWCTGSTLMLEDVRVAGTRGEEGTGEAGSGVAVGGRCELTGARVELVDNRHGGLLVLTGATADVSDLSVRGTRSNADLGGGHGVHVAFGSQATLRRVIVRGSAEAGISVAGAEAMTRLEDVLITGSTGRELDGRFGGGLSVSAGVVTGVNIQLDGNRHVGVYVGESGRATLDHLTIANTLPQDCASDGCRETPFGIGMGAFHGGRLEVADFAVQDSSLCGVMVASSSDVRLTGGSISSGRIGACVQASPFDLAKLTDAVSYEDNDLNLDSTSLPVPEAVPPLAQ